MRFELVFIKWLKFYYSNLTTKINVNNLETEEDYTKDSIAICHKLNVFVISPLENGVEELIYIIIKYHFYRRKLPIVPKYSKIVHTVKIWQNCRVNNTTHIENKFNTFILK